MKSVGSSQEAIIDSMPLEASRYNSYAPQNPYYQIEMDKAHIFHYGNNPPYMIYSDGTTNEKPCFYPLILTVSRRIRKCLQLFWTQGITVLIFTQISGELLTSTSFFSSGRMLSFMMRKHLRVSIS